MIKVPHVKFAILNKQSDLDDYQAEVKRGDYRSETVIVDEIVRMNEAEFDEFSNSFLCDFSWLKGKGGHTKEGIRICLMIVSPNRPTIYIDPQGFSYARYVGI